MTRGLIITKRPRSDPLPDRPAVFPPFKELHLELLEHKQKLRKGLPLIPVAIKKGLNAQTENFENVAPTQNTVSQNNVQHVQPSNTPQPNPLSLSKDYEASDTDQSVRSEGLSRKERRRLKKEES